MLCRWNRAGFSSVMRSSKRDDVPDEVPGIANGLGVWVAVYGQFSIRYPRLAVICLPLAVITLAVAMAASGKAIALPVTIVVSVFGTIAIGRILYRKGMV